VSRSATYPLHTLVETLGAARLIRGLKGPTDQEIGAVSDDSRVVTRGSIFVAVSGAEADGHGFVASAIERGASTVVVERDVPVPPEISVIEVTDSRRALAILSHHVAGSPSQRLRIVGVTGTNGKTTTAWLVHHMLTQAGRETGLLGTIESRIGAKRAVASLTTPGPVELSNTLSDMVDAGCTDCVMEVSSHALAQHRVAGLRFSAAIFTNLTRDHLDYHGTWDAYLNAKKSLFDGLDSSAAAVYNVDDPSALRIVDDCKATRHGFGRRPEADHVFEIVASDLRGLRLRVDGQDQSFQLVGEFNAYNLTAAYTLGRAFGFSPSHVLGALESARPVPGRLEQMTFDNGVTAIIDYAHTPDALINVLESVRAASRPSSRIWCVFGCGGDRDRGKRPQMGAIAERLADVVVVTSDNPRREDPSAILDDIRKGMQRPDDAHWIVDRREAIQFAARNTQPDDTVVVAGKGHEAYQVVGRDRIHFDDREEVKKWFA